jgi:maleylacetoacetate isomerase
MSQPILHDYHRSSAAYRVRIALNLKGVSYRSVPVDLLKGEQGGEDYRGLNPQGLVPMLEIDGLRLTQSLAILDYLDARFPKPRLVPRDPAARAHVLAMGLVVACDIHPLNNLRVLRYLKHELGVGDEARDGWYRHWVRDGLAALEAMAAEHGGCYLGGDAPGLADICVVPQLYNARRFNVPVEDFPALERIDTALCGLEPFAAAHPDRVASAP